MPPDSVAPTPARPDGDPTGPDRASSPTSPDDVSATGPQPTGSGASPAGTRRSDTRVSRRTLFGVSGAAAVVGAANGAAGAIALGKLPTATSTDARVNERLAAADATPKRVDLPQGLVDEEPAFGHLLTFDLTPETRSSTATARKAAIAFLDTMTQIANGSGSDPTGQAASARDLTPASLQVTPGVGASLLEACGLQAKRPAAFIDLPAFPSDKLRPEWSGGDLVVQVAAEDPMRLAGVVQQVVASAGPGVKLRWTRSGFKATRAASRPDSGAPRNLMGHHDGSANPILGTALWDFTVRSRGTDWMANGSYMVARRIMIDLTRWYRESVDDRDRVIGRSTDSGAPLGAARESDPADFGARDATGGLLIPEHAHARLASPSNNAGARIYRRPWNFDDGYDADGRRQAGLMFIAWQADLSRGFIPIQKALDAGSDALNDYITHVGSAVFAVPALGGDRYVGQRLLES